MRVFAGLPLPERTRETIAAWMKRWEAERKALKPVRPAGLHVTLHFFGEVDEGRAEEIGRALETIRRSRIDAALGDMGYAQGGRPFVPHITVARVRRGAAAADLPSFEPHRGARVTLDRLVLFRSILKPTGAEYHPLTTVLFDQ